MFWEICQILLFCVWWHSVRPTLCLFFQGTPNMYGSGNLADFLSARVAFTFPLEGDCFLYRTNLLPIKVEYFHGTTRRSIGYCFESVQPSMLPVLDKPALLPVFWKEWILLPAVTKFTLHMKVCTLCIKTSLLTLNASCKGREHPSNFVTEREIQSRLT